MARYSVSCERRKTPTSSIGKWNEMVTASSESEARSIAKDKAKLKFPDYIIAIGTAKKIG